MSNPRAARGGSIRSRRFARARLAVGGCSQRARGLGQARAASRGRAGRRHRGLERRDILRSGRTGRDLGYDFSHDLVRRAAYRQTSEPRKRLAAFRLPCSFRKSRTRAEPARPTWRTTPRSAATTSSACATPRPANCIRIFANAQGSRSPMRRQPDRLARGEIPCTSSITSASVGWRTCARELGERPRAVAEAQSSGSPRRSRAAGTCSPRFTKSWANPKTPPR